MSDREFPTDPKQLYHRGGHDTERDAAEAIFPTLNDLQWKVLQYAKKRWPECFTLVDVQNDLGSPTKSTHRTRVSELRKKGFIMDSGHRRFYPPSRRPHILWRFKPYQLKLPL